VSDSQEFNKTSSVIFASRLLSASTCPLLIVFKEYSPAESVDRPTMKLKGTVAFTLMVWALAAIVANVASAAVISMFPLILVSSLRLSAVFVEKETVSQAET
jgi:hypothetical protein